MPILSIQSHVAYGRVGNRAAVFALERLGHEVWPVNTVNFSNHPAMESWKGGIHQASDIAEIIDEIEKRKAFPNCAAILSGFIGDVAIGRAVLDAVVRVRKVNPRMFYALDPVIGDSERGSYVAGGIAEFFRDEAVSEADIVLPNVYELAVLSGQPIESVDQAAAAAAALLKRGPEMIVVKGLRHGGSVSALLVSGTQAWQATCPWVDVPAHGAGDLFAALFLGHFLMRGDARAALARAVHGVHVVLERTRALKLDALALVDAQDELVARSVPIVALPLWAA
jgi:pyridoxine kinase